MTNAELKAAIQAAIYENTEGAITGTALQDILLKIVEQVEVPIFNVETLSGTNITGTLAECAAAAGVSENMFLRLCNGDVPVVSMKVIFNGTPIYVYNALGIYNESGGPCVYRCCYYDDATHTMKWSNSGVEFDNLGSGTFTFKCIGY